MIARNLQYIFLVWTFLGLFLAAGLRPELFEMFSGPSAGQERLPQEAVLLAVGWYALYALVCLAADAVSADD